MAIVSEAGFSNIVQPGLKKAFINSFNEVPQGSLIGPLYKMESSDKPDEKFLEVEDLGNIPVFTGDLSYTEFREGNTKTLTHQEFALGLKLQRKLVDDDLYGVINQMVSGMGNSARYRMESDAAAPFVGAFGSSYTVFDGLSLCNSAHSFVSTSTTQSNSGTSAFSYAAMDAAIIAMRKWKGSQDRFIFNIYPDTLVGPPDLDTQFREVIDSKLKPGTTNNNINVFNSKFNIITTPFLSDTNDWFLVDSRRMKEFLIWVSRIPLEFKNAGDFDSYTKKYAMYMRYTNGPVHWPWVYGNSVS